MKWKTLLLVALSFILSIASAFPAIDGRGVGAGFVLVEPRRFLSGFKSGSTSSTKKKGTVFHFKLETHANQRLQLVQHLPPVCYFSTFL